MLRTCLIAILLCSCKSSLVEFRPREQAGAEGPEGHPAAQYQLERDGQKIAKVRVWSEGIQRFQYDTVAHVALEIENLSDIALRIDGANTYLQAVDSATDAELIDRVDDLEILGPTEVPGNGIDIIDLEFLLPEGIHPVDINTFAARWSLTDESGTEYRNVTPFGRDYVRARSVYRTSLHWGFGPVFYGYGYCW